uniref:Uncharacterized protein n=1 Tax=Anguilla anguilla TaxID=7936 RepID=A0A0E9V0P6_ANGAN
MERRNKSIICGCCTVLHNSSCCIKIKL